MERFSFWPWRSTGPHCGEEHMSGNCGMLLGAQTDARWQPARTQDFNSTLARNCILLITRKLGTVLWTLSLSHMTCLEPWESSKCNTNRDFSHWDLLLLLLMRILYSPWCEWAWQDDQICGSLTLWHLLITSRSSHMWVKPWMPADHRYI